MLVYSGSYDATKCVLTVGLCIIMGGTMEAILCPVWIRPERFVSILQLSVLCVLSKNKDQSHDFVEESVPMLKNLSDERLIVIILNSKV